MEAAFADNVRQLFRECLRRAEYIGKQNGNTNVLKAMVRHQFKRNMHETDPQKIEEMKSDAVRGLVNHMVFEAASIPKNSKQS